MSSERSDELEFGRIRLLEVHLFEAGEIHKEILQRIGLQNDPTQRAVYLTIGTIGIAKINGRPMLGT